MLGATWGIWERLERTKTGIASPMSAMTMTRVRGIYRTATLFGLIDHALSPLILA